MFQIPEMSLFTKYLSKYKDPAFQTYRFRKLDAFNFIFFTWTPPPLPLSSESPHSYLNTPSADCLILSAIISIPPIPLPLPFYHPHTPFFSLPLFFLFSASIPSQLYTTLLLSSFLPLHPSPPTFSHIVSLIPS